MDLVIKRQTPIKLHFGNLSAGDVFEYGGNTYMKVRVRITGDKTNTICLASPSANETAPYLTSFSPVAKISVLRNPLITIEER